jgi:hypothetical protein
MNIRRPYPKSEPFDENDGFRFMFWNGSVFEQPAVVPFSDFQMILNWTILFEIKLKCPVSANTDH